PVRVHRQVLRHREQPWPGGPVRDGTGVEPGAQQRLLHDVLGPLLVTIGHAQRVAEQRPGVLRVERADEILVAGLPGGLVAAGGAVVHHTLITVTASIWFTPPRHPASTGPSRTVTTRSQPGPGRAGRSAGSGPREMHIMGCRPDLDPGRKDADGGDPQVQGQG